MRLDPGARANDEYRMNEWKSDRREYARTDVVCAVTVSDEAYSDRINGKALNISDGGAMLAIPMDGLTELPPSVRLTMSLPRVTDNTRMYERIDTEATVVRHQPMVDENIAGVAVRFSAPLALQLEV